ncbi:MAG: diaminopimelate decarboxylase [Rhodospirillaceae bacterium]|jgi:diaminopimelate decarboxylase|nr:diaminopimelate decarboxylase [Rhodospirillaceae bacterium]MBT5195791.1 diaminopimelate decarboxylase [Rhodospirillaceae bacterium]MBT5899081.1 diaminopimelate decarboxylase [Rhodospirillaceae bacterium]MBT6427907.1 diaminopimelate decarboxylase [Rhodospirillaceae bacterium]MBT7759659.1 diaminopimelate decarboxylase [Rhodospirillaceae bacterium]
MDHFQYRHGILHAEDVSIPDIAAAIGTPFYCYSAATMTRHYNVLTGSLDGTGAKVCYAVKANSNQAVIRTMVELGAGADVISGGELTRALAAGASPDDVVFAGPGKTRDELAQALAIGIYQFNVESEQELRLLNAVAVEMGKVAPVSIRVNPDVDAGTHEKITTGRKQNKFGIPIDRAMDIFALGAELPGVAMLGVAVHIGSQITDLAPFEESFDRALGLVDELRAAGHDIRRCNLGGGLGIPYGGETPPPPEEYGRMVKRMTANRQLDLVLEPGRVLVGNAGILVARVVYEKHEGRRFIIIDAAMNDLIRPAMYDSWHDIVPVVEAAPDAPMTEADVVGPICESGDTLAKGRPMPPLAPNDLIAVRSAGAYGAVMASTYNSRPLVAEVMVRGDQYAVIRPRQTIDDLIALDQPPPWQQAELE